MIIRSLRRDWTQEDRLTRAKWMRASSHLLRMPRAASAGHGDHQAVERHAEGVDGSQGLG